MRRYDIVSGILLILSIIDFALAAPVSAQEKRQEIADVGQIPKDVITVLGKRWEEDLGKLGEDFLKTGGKPVESSSSAPSGLDNHGSTTNVVQPPAAPNLASSTTTTNPDPSSSGCSKRGLWARGGCLSALFEAETWQPEGPVGPVGPGGLGMDHGSPAPWPAPLLSHWQLISKLVLGLGPRPLIIDPSADKDFDWEYWLHAPDPPPGPLPKPPPGPGSPPKVFGASHWRKVDPAHPPSTSGYGPSPPLTMPEESEAVTPTTPESPDLRLSPLKEPEYHDEVVPEPPPSPDNRPVDLQAAIIAAKAKAKVPGTTRDHVGNAAQRE